MGLLRRVDNVPGIDYHEYRNYEYYSKYKYRARVTAVGFRCLYMQDNIEGLKRRVKHATEDRCWGIKLSNSEYKEIMDNIQFYESFLDWAKTNNKKKDRKVTIRLEGRTASCFSNDLDLLKELNMLEPSFKIDYTEVKLEQFAGTKYFVKEPLHKYRVYLRSTSTEKSTVLDLSNLLEKTQGLHPNNSFSLWIDRMKRYKYNRVYVSSMYFIDYDDESTLSYLALMHGDLLGKRFKLEKRPVAV